jgi:hypothetical protein
MSERRLTEIKRRSRIIAGDLERDFRKLQQTIGSIKKVIRKCSQKTQ